MSQEYSSAFSHAFDSWSAIAGGATITITAVGDARVMGILAGSANLVFATIGKISGETERFILLTGGVFNDSESLSSGTTRD